MRILVTGAPGFLGSPLVEELRRKLGPEKLRVLAVAPAPEFSDTGVEVQVGSILTPADVARALGGRNMTFAEYLDRIERVSKEYTTTFVLMGSVRGSVQVHLASGLNVIACLIAIALHLRTRSVSPSLLEVPKGGVTRVCGHEDHGPSLALGLRSFWCGGAWLRA
jgi:hypothetical protein